VRESTIPVTITVAMKTISGEVVPVMKETVIASNRVKRVKQM
jgi:ABC-type arginine/histidine transport system permease subunit